MKAWQHLKTILHHKGMVRKGCFRVGLYRQGIMHDWSKYSPVEFLVGCKYYQGTRSPNNAERSDKGYSSAWLHHKGRNKHHLEYWIDYAGENGEMSGMRMPKKYVVEMFIDRIAASKNYQKEKYTDKSPLEYYEKHGDCHYIIHKETQRLLEKLLRMLSEEGEEKVFRYIRRNVLKNERVCTHRKTRKNRAKRKKDSKC